MIASDTGQVQPAQPDAGKLRHRPAVQRIDGRGHIGGTDACHHDAVNIRQSQPVLHREPPERAVDGGNGVGRPDEQRLDKAGAPAAVRRKPTILVVLPPTSMPMTTSPAPCRFASIVHAPFLVPVLRECGGNRRHIPTYTGHYSTFQKKSRRHPQKNSSKYTNNFRAPLDKKSRIYYNGFVMLSVRYANTRAP